MTEAETSMEEPIKVRKPFFSHKDDQMSTFSRLIKIAQNKLGMRAHSPKVGVHSEKTYYKLDRSENPSSKVEEPTQA